MFIQQMEDPIHTPTNPQPPNFPPIYTTPFHPLLTFYDRKIKIINVGTVCVFALFFFRFKRQSSDLATVLSRNYVKKINNEGII